MTHTTKRNLATLAIAVLTLVGCSNDTEQTDEGATEAQGHAQDATTDQPEQSTTGPEKPEGMSQEEWEANLEYAEQNPDSSPVEMDGPTAYPTNADYYFFGEGRAIGKFSLPTEPTEEIQEAFKVLAPDDEATFIKVTVDNREGDSQYTVDDISGYDADGKEYQYQDLGASMAEPLWSIWEDIDIHSHAEMQQYDELEATLDSHDNIIEPGAVKDVWLISPEANLPDEFSRLGINGGSSYMGGTDPLPVEMAEFDLDFEAPAQS